jgi:hypothetical protein
MAGIDPELRVHGMQGLRALSVLVIPSIIGVIPMRTWHHDDGSKKAY